jgi:hypothetical protein
MNPGDEAKALLRDDVELRPDLFWLYGGSSLIKVIDPLSYLHGPSGS